MDYKLRFIFFFARYNKWQLGYILIKNTFSVIVLQSFHISSIGPDTSIPSYNNVYKWTLI